jgi:hypothetical protein
MSQKQYAFIKNNEVVNTLVIDESDTDFIEFQKTTYDADQVIVIDGYETAHNVLIGGTFDGEKFWVPKPYPSWIKDMVDNTWTAPVPYPEDHSLVYKDIGINQVFYNWNESAQDWDLLPVLDDGYCYVYNSKLCLFEVGIAPVTIGLTDNIKVRVEGPPA